MGPKELFPLLEKGKFQPVYLLHGLDTYLLQTTIDRIIKHAMGEGDTSFDLDIFFGSESSAESVVTAVQSVPMIQPYRVVVVKDAEKILNTEPLPGYIRNPSSQSILILTIKEKTVKRTKARRRTKQASASHDTIALIEEKYSIVRIREMNESEAETWIISAFKEKGKTLSKPLARMLITLKGTSAADLIQEVEKLSVATTERTVISEEDLFSHIGLSREFNIFELSDKLGNRDGKGAMIVMQRLIESIDVQMIIATLTRHYINLWKVRFLAQTPGSLQKSVKQKEIEKFDWQWSKLLPQSRKYTKDELLNSFSHLCFADYRLKTSNINKTVIMTQLVSNLLNPLG